MVLEIVLFKIVSSLSHINDQIKSEMTLTYVNENLMRLITERTIGITNKLNSKTFGHIEA